MQYCSLQHRTLLLSPVTSPTGYCFRFGSFPSFVLELFLHWSPVAYWAPINLGSSSFSILSFCLFILFMGFSRQEYWSGLPFPSLVDTFCQTSPPQPNHLGITTRPSRYDLNQIPYDYTVEVRNRFKGLDLIDREPDELWEEVHDIVQETGIKTIPMEKKCKKAKWLSEEALQIAVKWRKAKSKGKIFPFEYRVSKNSQEK